MHPQKPVIFLSRRYKNFAYLSSAVEVSIPVLSVIPYGNRDNCFIQ